MKINEKRIFISHTKKDKKICDDFDRIVARVGIKSFRSEFENIPLPPWKTIKNALNESVALFFLVGKELVNSQDSGDSNWKYTQNWIAYEMGLACQLGIDVWAICDDEVLINFPMPYINNYLVGNLEEENTFKYLRYVLKKYKKVCDSGIFKYPETDSDGLADSEPEEVGSEIEEIRRFKASLELNKKLKKFIERDRESRKPRPIFPFPFDSNWSRGVTCPHEGCKMRFNIHWTYSHKIIICPHCLKELIKL